MGIVEIKMAAEIALSKFHDLLRFMDQSLGMNGALDDSYTDLINNSAKTWSVYYSKSSCHDL